MSAADASVTVYGAAYSVYVRIVRIALHEKGVPYDLVPIDVFAEDGLPADYRARHPFGRIPAFEHDGFGLYETSAITRYVDEAFSGPPLQPRGLRERARMNQIIAMLDNYAYRPMVWDVYVQRVETAPADKARIAAGLEKARTVLAALSDLLCKGHWLAGPEPSLADFHAAPMFALFEEAPEGARLLADFPEIHACWERVKSRPSVLAAGA
ncbi:glutathione S-transferase family protein [Shinella yambaruensis]|uniref:glutathione transferase n=1 Tax=Shinella yambaruensis TaxID=415996 RepID=A0ABQ5ZKJ0_9HYPH|nr:glutathione S-transferase family protein [Shinella yambaruensis]MCJ8024013.1 glutathione S-transferase family protein [Shinella yambaruensis]MCU7978837.1 glutathione S-transferase family protein [Shinella yambaruensis]GLR53339.1 glutathione S-transferase [Shinella yambaruensis]